MSSPYLTTMGVAEHLLLTETCKDPKRAAWQWIKRHQLRTYRVGRDVRVLRVAVDAVLRDEALERERRQSQFKRQAFHAGATVIQGGRG